MQSYSIDYWTANGYRPLPQGYHSTPITGRVPWTTPGLRVIRLNLLSDPGFPFWDVSYCHGMLNGQKVDVELPFDQIPKRKSIKGYIIDQAKRDGIFAKGIGILDVISTLN